jgi:ribosomal protein L21E
MATHNYLPSLKPLLVSFGETMLRLAPPGFRAIPPIVSVCRHVRVRRWGSQRRCRFHKENEEHGFVDITHAKRDFAVGHVLHIIASHVCVAVNLHEYVYGIRGEQVETVWKVEGRGKLQ